MLSLSSAAVTIEEREGGVRWGTLLQYSTGISAVQSSTSTVASVCFHELKENGLSLTIMIMSMAICSDRPNATQKYTPQLQARNYVGMKHLFYFKLAVSTRPPDGANYCLGPAGLYSLGPCGPLSGGGKEFHQHSPGGTCYCATAPATATARMFHCCSPGVAVMNSLYRTHRRIKLYIQINDLDFDLD